MKSHAPTSAEREELRMDAYYYGFEPTGVIEIDRLLSAVASAGKGFHSTEDWRTAYGDGRGTPESCIQQAANEAATAWNRRAAMQTAEPVDLWALIDAYADHHAEYARSTARHLASAQRENVEDAKAELTAALASLAAPDRAPSIAPVARCDYCSGTGEYYFEGAGAPCAHRNGTGRAPSIDSAADANAARLAHIERKHVMGASYGGITSLNIIVHGDDYALGGALYAIDCMAEREAGNSPAIAALQPEGK